MKKVSVKYGQTIEDLALLHYGCLEACVAIMADNDLSVDSLLFPGQILLIRDPTPEFTESNLALLMELRFDAVEPVTGIATQAPETSYVLQDYIEDDYFKQE